MNEVLRRDLPHVMHETIDDEVVVVNLSTGTYYSLDGVGVHVWEWIDGRRSADDLVRIARVHFAGEGDAVAQSVRRFLAELREEGLVAAEAAETGGSPDPAPPVGTVAFAEPAVQKYTDMEALLLADPIHDVDESAGWPHKK
jgi:hypothetical protein